MFLNLELFECFIFFIRSSNTPNLRARILNEINLRVAFFHQRCNKLPLLHSKYHYSPKCSNNATSLILRTFKLMNNNSVKYFEDNPK